MPNSGQIDLTSDKPVTKIKYFFQIISYLQAYQGQKTN